MAVTGASIFLQGIDTLSAVDGRNAPWPGSGHKAALPPNGKRLSSIVRPQALIMDCAKPQLSDGGGIGFELIRRDAGRRETLLFQELSKQFPRRASAA